MERWIKFSGIIGAVIFLFGVLGVLLGLTPSRTLLGDPLLLLHFIAGIVLVIYWFIASGFKNIGATGEVVKGRNTRYGANALIYTAVMLGILTCVNYLAHKRNKRWDLTEQGVYSLSAQSKKTISALNQPLKLVAFKVTEDSQYMTDLLNLYREANPSKVSTEVVDPRTKINLVEKYEMKQGNVIYLEYGEGEKKAVSRLNDLNEEAITNSVIKLTRGSAKKIYYVTGHDEPSIESMNQGGFQKFAKAIEDEHLTIEPILLSTTPKLPEDTAALILASPKKSLLAEEKDAIIKYAESGGRLMLFADPRTTSDVKDIADKFGIMVGDNVVIDQIQRLFSAPTLGAQPVVQDYSTTSPITQNFNKTTVTIYNIASSVTYKKVDPAPKDITYDELIMTSPTSWAESNMSAMFDSPEPTAQKEDNDLAGPVSLAVSYEKKLSTAEKKDDASAEAKFDNTSRVVVFGDSDWILNENFEIYANRDLVLNTVNWVVGEEGGISIRPKKMRASTAEITRDVFLTMLRSSLIVPELILLLGLFIWWRRRGVTA